MGIRATCYALAFVTTIFLLYEFTGRQTKSFIIQKDYGVVITENINLTNVRNRYIFYNKRVFKFSSFAFFIYPIKNTLDHYGNNRRFQLTSRLLQVAAKLFFLRNLHKISHLLTLHLILISDRKFQKNMVDGIYKLTLQRIKNAIYSVFWYIFAIKKTVRQ